MRGQALFAKLGDMSTATIPLRVPTFDLSDRLRKARESAGFDQVQLSEQIGISRTSISAAERGSSKPRKAVLIAWAFATRVPFEWLMTGSTNNETPDPDGPGGELLRLDSNQQPSGYRLGHNVTFLFPSRPSWDNTDDLPSIA